MIVVDDDSTDRTTEVAARAGAVVLHTGEYGGSGRAVAILAGSRRALESGCMAVVLLDSDGKYLTREIPRLAAPVLAGEADLVIGSRNLAGRKGIPAYQLETTGQSCLMSEKPARFTATDPGSTFRAFNARAVDLLDLLPDPDIFEESMNEIFLRRGLVGAGDPHHAPAGSPRAR